MHSYIEVQSAAELAFLSMALRAVLRGAAVEDPEVVALRVAVEADGDIALEFIGTTGAAVGGMSL